MEKLLLVRHGESYGNSKNIIQGKCNFSLTDKGKNDTRQIVNDKIELFEKYDSIISSTLIRGLQTSNIISSIIHKEIVYDTLVEEFSAGMIEGLAKMVVQSKFPEYYKIWQTRGDLDNIPFAESGDDLQIRVLMFLEQFMNKEYNSIVVSHAGFIRCLYNTINGLKRNTLLNIENNKIYEVERVFENIPVKEHTIARNSKVFEFETYEKKYIIKKMNRLLELKDYNEFALIDYLSHFSHNVPKIIKIINRDNKYSIKGIEYKPGTNIYDNLTEGKIKTTILELNRLQNILEHCPLNGRYDINDMEKNIVSAVSKVHTPEIAAYGMELLNSRPFLNGIKNDNKILVHDDLHRGNILYDNERVYFLDFEGVSIFPKSYQLASHIAASYILNNSNVSINYLINLWPEKIDFNYLKELIKYRLFMGACYFDEKCNNICDNEDVNLKKKYILSLRKLDGKK